LAHEEVLGRRRGGGGYKKKNLFPQHFQSTYNIQRLSPLLPGGRRGEKIFDHGLENIVLKP
jgi:hypothetical protein